MTQEGTPAQSSGGHYAFQAGLGSTESRRVQGTISSAGDTSDGSRETTKSTRVRLAEMQAELVATKELLKLSNMAKAPIAEPSDTASDYIQYPRLQSRTASLISAGSVPKASTPPRPQPDAETPIRHVISTPRRARSASRTPPGNAKNQVHSDRRRSRSNPPEGLIMPPRNDRRRVKI